MLISSIPFQQNTLIHDTNSQKVIKNYYSNNQKLIESATHSLSRGLTSVFLINEVKNAGATFMNLLMKAQTLSHVTQQANAQLSQDEYTDNKILLRRFSVNALLKCFNSKIFILR
ncbi:hypothetical protein [Providencia sp. PROV033]|uniref:hypothetical protein n=1 Tax=Providencia sp. PROV033 TaxID=2949765 RepID=UPI002349F036|nr:hypothetical protein [Providencia sp. PROV033]